jgi:hypothetical protein
MLSQQTCFNLVVNTEVIGICLYCFFVYRLPLFLGYCFSLINNFNNGIQERILHNRAQLGSCTNVPLVVEYYPVTGDTHDSTDTSYKQSK